MLTRPNTGTHPEFLSKDDIFRMWPHACESDYNGIPIIVNDRFLYAQFDHDIDVWRPFWNIDQAYLAKIKYMIIINAATC